MYVKMLSIVHHVTTEISLQLSYLYESFELLFFHFFFQRESII